MRRRCRPAFVLRQPALHSGEGVVPVFAEAGLAEGVVQQVERFDQVAEAVGAFFKTLPSYQPIRHVE